MCVIVRLELMSVFFGGGEGRLVYQQKDKTNKFVRCPLSFLNIINMKKTF